MKAVILACVLLLPAVASAEEYTLYVNDAASCRAAGFTGDVCIVKKVESSTPAFTPAPTPTPTPTPSPNPDCVVTVWNACAGTRRGS